MGRDRPVPSDARGRPPAIGGMPARDEGGRLTGRTPTGPEPSRAAGAGEDVAHAGRESGRGQDTEQPERGPCFGGSSARLRGIRAPRWIPYLFYKQPSPSTLALTGPSHLDAPRWMLYLYHKQQFPPPADREATDARPRGSWARVHPVPCRSHASGSVPGRPSDGGQSPAVRGTHGCIHRNDRGRRGVRPLVSRRRWVS